MLPVSHISFTIKIMFSIFFLPGCDFVSDVTLKYCTEGLVDLMVSANLDVRVNVGLWVKVNAWSTFLQLIRQLNLLK